jgi:hypothetical protein
MRRPFAKSLPDLSDRYIPKSWSDDSIYEFIFLKRIRHIFLSVRQFECQRGSFLISKVDNLFTNIASAARQFPPASVTHPRKHLLTSSHFTCFQNKTTFFLKIL